MWEKVSYCDLGETGQFQIRPYDDLGASDSTMEEGGNEANPRRFMIRTRIRPQVHIRFTAKKGDRIQQFELIRTRAEMQFISESSAVNST